jgi:hypothetical protein
MFSLQRWVFRIILKSTPTRNRAGVPFDFSASYLL